MATRRTSEEKDYQDLLKVTQSMLGDMGKAMSDLGDSSDGRNRKLKQEADITKQILGSVTDVADTNKLINAISRQQTNINKQNYGVNEQLKNSQLAQLDAVKAILQTAQQTAKVFKAVDDILSETASSFTSGIDGIMGKLKGIPIVGKALGNLFQPVADNAKKIINKTVSKFGTGFKKSFLESRAGGKGFTDSLTNGLKGGMNGMSGMVRVAGKFLAALGPVGIAIAVIAAGLAIGFARFTKLDAAAKAFREETGLLNSQTTTLQGNIKSVSTEFAGLGVSADDVSKSASAFTKEFSGLEQPSKEVLGSMVALNKNFGIGVQEGAQLNKVFQNIGGLTAEQSQELIGQTAEMAKMAEVAPSQVIKDMAESSEYAYKYFNGSPKALAAAAVQAAKLGTSIKEAGAVADNLLDFESSITSELEASAILGTNLNLSQARYLAANGDILGAQQAVLDQVGSLGDLTKLNTFEQKALTDATGMQMGDLINQQRIREQLGKLDKEQLASVNSLMSAGRDITSLTKEDLAAQTKRLASQGEMQSVMDTIANKGSAISTAFQDMFEPFASTLMPFVSDVISMLSFVLVPTLQFIGKLIGYILSPLSAIREMFIALTTEGAGGLVDKMRELGPIVSGIGIVLSAVILPSLLSGAISLGRMVLSAGIWAIQMIAGAIASITAASAMTLGIGAIAIAAGIGVAMAAMNSGMSSASSIDDGVVQDGKVVGTNPADTIIAMKKPQDLANSMQSTTSPMIDISALVSKLDEVVNAVASNRDVFLDREKVSSSVVKTNEKSGENRFGLMGA
jgi:hypothetical protein